MGLVGTGFPPGEMRTLQALDRALHTCLETGSHCVQTKPSTGKDRQQWEAITSQAMRRGPVAGVSGQRRVSPPLDTGA